MSRLAPIILFTYNRPEHTQLTIEALIKNHLSTESDLIIYSDGARTQKQIQKVNEVRKYLSTISGFHRIKLIHRSHNFGLAKSIIQGVTEVLQQFERVIVLEDDMIISPYFLTYMNDALEQFANNERVISIHGYVYPVEQELPEAFFIPGADCWGWATWRRGWEIFNSDGQFLLDELTRQDLLRNFDFNGAYPYSLMLKEQIEGGNDSWAIRWYASAFLHNKLTLYPGCSLVHNIGNDNSGTHCGDSGSMNVNLSENPINLKNIKVEVSPVALAAFEKYFNKNKPNFFVGLLKETIKCALRELTQLGKIQTLNAMATLAKKYLRKFW